MELWIIMLVVFAVWFRKTMSKGNRSFWRAVREHPVLAILWMAFDEAAWEFSETRPEGQCSGPFRINDKNSSVATVVWGREPAFERSQDRFLRLVDGVDERQELFIRSLFYTEMIAISMVGGVATVVWRTRAAGILEDCIGPLLRELGLDPQDDGSGPSSPNAEAKISCDSEDSRDAMDQPHAATLCDENDPATPNPRSFTTSFKAHEWELPLYLRGVVSGAGFDAIQDVLGDWDPNAELECCVGERLPEEASGSSGGSLCPHQTVLASVSVTPEHRALYRRMIESPEDGVAVYFQLVNEGARHIQAANAIRDFQRVIESGAARTEVEREAFLAVVTAAERALPRS